MLVKMEDEQAHSKVLSPVSSSVGGHQAVRSRFGTGSILDLNDLIKNIPRRHA